MSYVSLDFIVRLPDGDAFRIKQDRAAALEVKSSHLFMICVIPAKPLNQFILGLMAFVYFGCSWGPATDFVEAYGAMMKGTSGQTHYCRKSVSAVI